MSIGKIIRIAWNKVQIFHYYGELTANFFVYVLQVARTQDHTKIINILWTMGGISLK